MAAMPVLRFLPLALVSVLALACDDRLDDGSGGSGVGGEGQGAAGGSGGAGGGGAGLPTKEQLSAGWNELVPGGDTICSRGTPYAFFVRPGTSNKVVIDFIGGGACWNELTCGFAGAIFEEDVESVRAAIEANQPEGFYDHENADNPVADFWHVVIPYCTGDIHWGDNVATYGSGDSAVTINHKGAVNTRAVLGWVYDNFDAPEQLFVTGCSAGSYGSALWSAHVMDHYPSSQVFQFGDSGAGVITQDFFENSFPSWNATQAFPSWIPALDPTKVDLLSLGLADLYAGIANHEASQVLSQYNTVRDENQVFFFTAMGGSDVAAWSSQMQASIADIETRAPNFASFTAPGEQHCILPYANFYTVQADGVRLVDWLRGMLDGESAPASVACQGAECDAETP